MFERYLLDSYDFIKSAEVEPDEKKAKRYYRAAIFYIASAIEAFVNNISDALSKGNALTNYETAFLTDKKFCYANGKIEMQEQREFHRLEDKLKLVLIKFSPTFKFQNTEWTNFTEFKRFRDTITHPKTDDEEYELRHYKKIARAGLSSAIKLMNLICIGVFRKPLRKKILELL